MTLPQAYGQVLEQLCKERGITQTLLFEKTALEQKTIQRYWYGERVPNLKNSILIAEALGISTGQMIDQVIDFWRDNNPQ